MEASVRAEVNALEDMAPAELRAKWRDIFGEKTRCGGASGGGPNLRGTGVASTGTRVAQCVGGVEWDR
jgi:hypothetical protein